MHFFCIVLRGMRVRQFAEVHVWAVLGAFHRMLWQPSFPDEWDVVSMLRGTSKHALV
jgi:hypothetical protein